MKKGLSVLLIAAALFGFYGGAVNLNDVLACKDYWEVKGEETTADMNKLEDGLNQLKENEKAYLDGLDAVKDGEETLAKGEADYAAGQAQLAKGEADYAAAPGKLADARAQIAQGESDLAAGAEQLDGLSQLINGINKILKGYKNNWRPGYEALKEGRDMLYKGSRSSMKSLTDLALFLDDNASRDAYIAAVADVAGDDEKQTADDYKEFIDSTNTMADALPQIQKSVKEKDQQANALLGALKAPSTNLDFAGVVSAKREGLLAFASLITNKSQRSQYVSGVNTVADAYDNFNNLVEENYKKALNAPNDEVPSMTNLEAATYSAWQQFLASGEGQQTIAGTKLLMAKGALAQQGVTDPTDEQIAAVASQISDDQAIEQIKADPNANAKIDAAAKAGIKEKVKAQVKAGYESNGQLTDGRSDLTQAMATIAATLDSVNEQVNGSKSLIKTMLLPGLRKFNGRVSTDDVEALTSGQDEVANGIRTIAQAVLGNKALRDGVEENLGSDAIMLLQAYKLDPNPLNTVLSDFAAFEGQMDTKPALVNVLVKARGLLVTTKANGQDEYDDGVAKLADGKALYAQGLAEYAAAPAKLAEGRRQLAEGLQKLMDGRKELADGKEKLAEYEDGEQQVRDGLATLVATEPDGGLTSILERLDGDKNFDDPNGHLLLDKGLDAVDVGRGYQSDSGELITEEITKRAIGTAAGFAAAALALLAGILSLLKKNKGAGVAAILTAIAGAVGIGIGTNAGMEFSPIAGSTIGTMPWVAAGILAVVAAAHAIVHFTGSNAEE